MAQRMYRAARRWGSTGRLTRGKALQRLARTQPSRLATPLGPRRQQGGARLQGKRGPGFLFMGGSTVSQEAGTPRLAGRAAMWRAKAGQHVDGREAAPALHSEAASGPANLTLLRKLASMQAPAAGMLALTGRHRGMQPPIPVTATAAPHQARTGGLGRQAAVRPVQMPHPGAAQQTTWWGA